MIALGVDACLGRCSVAVVSGETVLGAASEAMARGHVERLAPMVGEVLAQAGIEPGDLDRIGVTCGPGGFTGARLGASFARGLALATGARAVGVSTLEAIGAGLGGRVLVALDGRRGDLFVQDFGPAPGAMRAIPVNDISRYARGLGFDPGSVVGPEALPDIDPVTVARLSMREGAGGPPHPIYLRAPDAKPAARPVLR